MAFCTQCGRGADPAGTYCTECGAPLHTAAGPGSFAYPRETAADEGHYPSAETARPRLPRPTGRKARILAGAAALVVAAAGVTAWQIYGHAARLTASTVHRSPTATGPAGPLQQAPLTASPVPSPVPSPSPSPSASPTASPLPSTLGSDAVAIAPGVTQQPGSQQIAAFFESYFKAINDHSFQEYSSLFDQQVRQGLTAEQFTSGYRSTIDSAATLTGISTTDTGSVAATMTFTSHQNQADSADHTGCTNWNVTLYLEQQGSGYLIGQPPPSYHASFHPCA